MAFIVVAFRAFVNEYRFAIANGTNGFPQRYFRVYRQQSGRYLLSFHSIIVGDE